MQRITFGLVAGAALLLGTASSASAGDFYFGISSGGYGASYFGSPVSPYHGVHRHVIPRVHYYPAPRVHYGHSGHSVYAPRGYYSSRPSFHGHSHWRHPGPRARHGRPGFHY